MAGSAGPVARAASRIFPPTSGAEIESREALRKKRRGRLLAEVCGRVYENDAEAQVSLPRDAVLGVESDPSQIAAVVARTRDQLSMWR